MQTLKMDFQSQSAPPVVPVMQSDSQSRFIGITLYDGGTAYRAPEGAVYTVEYHGPGPKNTGWYDTIQLSSGTRKAVVVDSDHPNVVTLELAEQALRVNGNVFVNLCVVTNTGYMLKTFPILCRVTGAAFPDTVAVQSFFYVTGITSEQWLAYVTACQDAQKRAEDAAATFETDTTLSVSGKAADAAKVGEAVNAEAERAKGVESQLKEDIDEFYKPISDLDSGDVDLFISDSYGNVLATFKDGEFNTKEFNTVKSIGNNICDTLEDCDLAISDVQGNVAIYVADGNIITPRYNTKNHHYSTFSILGDSYSTFKGYTDPLNNLQWYPPSDSATQGSENDVENVENTWWYLFANDYKSLLVQNNSYSGSCISYDSYGTGTVDGKNFSFVKRCENLKKAELIIIEGGTNDAWANVSLGEYRYADWTESDFETFRPSCSYVLDYIKRNNIGAKIIFILNDGLKVSITESIKTICEHYSVDVLELSNIQKSNKHPSIEGMKQIKEQLINFLSRG